MANTAWREEAHERNRKEKLETYLFAMKEDLSEWLAGLMNISVTAESFMSVLNNGIHICQLANMIQRAAERYFKKNPTTHLTLPTFVATYKERGASYGSFVSRDNVANFIRWCRELGISDVIIFESEDLVLDKYQKPVILTLLDVARRAAKFDVEPPDLVKMEEQIDEEIALEQRAANDNAAAALSTTASYSQSHGREHHENTDHNISQPLKVNSQPLKVNPQPLKVNPQPLREKPTQAKHKTKNFIPKNLDTLVKETVEQCTCENNAFPIEKIADGKYKIGENRVLIFVRVMRNHVMVRVGGGWDTLENYIQKHDPCRNGARSCGNGYRRSRCQTSNHHTGQDQDATLHSASNTSVASSDSSSSSSSLSRLSPGSSQSNSLQSMVCVFGQSTGPRTEMASNGDGHQSPPSTPFKQFETPVKSEKKKSTKSAAGLGTRYKSLTDLSGEHKGREHRRSSMTTMKHTTPANALSASANNATLRSSLQKADLTFGRSKTSDAILSRTRRQTKDSESPNSVVKRRGNVGTPSREASSDSLRVSRPKTTGMRRKSVDARKKSPEVRKRMAVSPAPARRRLEPEYDTKSNDIQKRSALRKDLNDNNLMFSRSVSADTIRRDNRTQRTTPDSMKKSLGSRIPVPVTSYGKPRELKSTSEDNQVHNGTLNGSHNNNTEGLNRCNHCDGECCTCDEGFIDGEISRSAVRPNTLFINSERQKEFQERALNTRIEHDDSSSKIHNGEYDMKAETQEHKIHVKKMGSESSENNSDISWKDSSGCSENDTSLEWKEVMTDILKFEENRIPDGNF